jgi:elongation factor P
MATTNDLKNGMTLNLDGQLWTVVEFQHVKPGKGPAFVRTKMKQVLTGKVVEKTFNAGIKVDVAILEKRDMQYLYKDGDDYMFMDSTSFDQIAISKFTVGDAVDYMLENADVIVAILEKRDMQYLYKDGDDYMFMDSTSFDQISISKVTVGDAVDYMLENADVIVAIHEGNALFVELPASVELTITYTEPGIQGDRSSGGTKPATLETGITVQVPLFIKQNEKVLVDTRNGSYLGRAN